jgi:hypothetical protein
MSLFQLLHTIGACYIQKATTFLKSKRFFGGGFFSRVKEKTTIVKEGWGVLGSAMSVQAAMEEMERQQQQGTLGEDELEALAKDVTSKVCRRLELPLPCAWVSADALVFYTPDPAGYLAVNQVRGHPGPVGRPRRRPQEGGWRYGRDARSSGKGAASRCHLVLSDAVH